MHQLYSCHVLHICQCVFCLSWTASCNPCCIPLPCRNGCPADPPDLIMLAHHGCEHTKYYQSQVNGTNNIEVVCAVKSFSLACFTMAFFWKSLSQYWIMRLLLPSLQVQRAEMAIIHPSWTGNVEDGYDAALLRLSRDPNVRIPQLAERDFDLYANSKVYGLSLGSVLKVAQFDVVKNGFCPKLRNLGNNTFCAYSSGAKMDSGTLACWILGLPPI